jgi:hypothetical protein
MAGVKAAQLRAARKSKKQTAERENMATTGKYWGAAVGGTIGGVIGAGAGIATGGTAIPATIPFATVGAGAGYAIGDIAQDVGTTALRNQIALVKAGRSVQRDSQQAIRQPLRTLSKMGKKWGRLW